MLGLGVLTAAPALAASSTTAPAVSGPAFAAPPTTDPAPPAAESDASPTSDAEPSATPTPEPSARTGRPSVAEKPTARHTTRPAPARARTTTPAAGPPDEAEPAGTCHVAPPPAIDSSEKPTADSPALAALPVPAQPAGGTRMGECGDILPAGGPKPPAGQDTVSWIIADLDTGAVLAARDPHARERPASCLKILLSLVVLKNLDMTTQVDGTEADADAVGSRVGVGPGGHYTVRQLFTGLILNSGNDAANALSRQLGGVPATLRDMTDMAASMGATDTRPTSPSGLDAPGMSSSAYDLALFYRKAIAQPVFAEISRTRLFDWPGRGDLPGFQISNDNHMLAEYPGTFGGKTGFTDDARHTRITAAEKNGRRLVVVQMRGETHPIPIDTQAARLLDYGFSLPAGTPPVGSLVDGPAAPPGDDANNAGAVAPAPDQVAPAPSGTSTENLPAALGVIGGGALLGALLSVLLARRTNQTSRHRH